MDEGEEMNRTFREIKEKGSDFLCTFSVYMIIGMAITSIIYGISAENNKDGQYRYCKWTPNRLPSAVYWAVEYLPKKATCFIWQPWEEQENK